jgi:hypothetical protein
MILKTLETLGPLHGYGIARRIEQTSGSRLALNYGPVAFCRSRIGCRSRAGAPRRASRSDGRVGWRVKRGTGGLQQLAERMKSLSCGRLAQVYVDSAVILLSHMAGQGQVHADPADGCVAWVGSAEQRSDLSLERRSCLRRSRWLHATPPRAKRSLSIPLSRCSGSDRFAQVSERRL